MNEFYAGIYRVVAAVPPGRVISYGAIARYLGHPRAARQVGRAMAVCPRGLPWWRVVKQDGSIPSPAHPDLWRGLLEGEGVGFTEDGRVDMARYRWLPETK